MTPKDKAQLRTWLASGESLSGVEACSAAGLVENERFTERARQAYRLIWRWSALRFGGVHGRVQERFYKRRGMEALLRRIERCRRIAARIAAGG